MHRRTSPGQRIGRIDDYLIYHFYPVMPEPNFFTTGSPFLSHPLLTTARTASEVDRILESTQLAPPATILDVACGFGRHSIELARRGFAVTAIDSSPAMVQEGRRASSDSGVADSNGVVDFLIADARTFSTDVLFDAAICLFTSLGQVDEQGDNIALVANTFTNLRPGAYFVVEVPQLDVTVAHMKTHETITGPNAEVHIERSYNADKRVMTEQFERVSATGTKIYVLQYRLFDSEEARSIVCEAGFDLLAIEDGFSGQPCRPDSPSMLILATRPPLTTSHGAQWAPQPPAKR